MRLSGIGELAFLEKIRERFRTRSREIVTGIGDDAAVVIPRRQKLLLSTDMMAEGVHFDRRFITPYQLGFKIVSVNVSDIYAMGGEAGFLLLALAAAGATEATFIDSFFDGIQKALDVYGLDLVGGDLSSSKSGMLITATVVGYAKKPILRSGARPGDRIYVTGNMGDSACGLEVLRKIGRNVPIDIMDSKMPRRAGAGMARSTGPLRKTPRPPEVPVAKERASVVSQLSKLGIAWGDAEPLMRRHLMPEARNPRKLSGKATAMIDISDGLFIDLLRLCEESGVGARIFMEKIPLSPQMKKTARVLGLRPYGLATAGGEDYELLFTAPRREKIPFPCIGEITVSERVVVGPGKRERQFRPEGYTHWD